MILVLYSATRATTTIPHTTVELRNDPVNTFVIMGSTTFLPSYDYDNNYLVLSSLPYLLAQPVYCFTFILFLFHKEEKDQVWTRERAFSPSSLPLLPLLPDREQHSFTFGEGDRPGQN